MDRAPLRQHFDNEAHKKEQRKQFEKQMASFEALEDTLIDGFNKLFKFLDGKTTKTEIVNHLKEIRTPDVEKVVKSLEKLDKTTLSTKVELKPVLEALNALQAQIKAIPKAEFTQKEEIKVINLDEIKVDFSDLEKAIKDLELKVDVKAPIIKTEKVDLKPLQEIMLDLLKAFNKFKVEPTKEFKVSNLKDIKPTDTSKIEKKLDTGNKYLKEISEKRFGGGGGGGESTLAFPLYADKTTSIVTVGSVKTITETDGTRTLTTTIDKTDPNNKSMEEVWS